MVKNIIPVFMLLLLSLVGTAIIVLMLANSPNSPNNANNQEFKERTLILINEKKEDDTTYKEQYKIIQLTKKKIEMEICNFENDVKTDCVYDYPGFGFNMFKDGEYISLLDALEIQPGDTTTINMEDLEDEIWEKYKYLFDLFGEEEGEKDEP